MTTSHVALVTQRTFFLSNMTEGGIFPWKVQLISQPNPLADYRPIYQSLPLPPRGYRWQYVPSTREWKVISNLPTGHPDGGGSRRMTTSSGVVHEATTDSNRIVSDLKLLESESKDGKEKTVFPECVEHVILPSDTLPGICLSYKVTPTVLRQYNRFSGSTLLLAPRKLKIPITEEAKRANIVFPIQDVNSTEYKVHSVRVEIPQLSVLEATAYV
jgi:LysM repeat protein